MKKHLLINYKNKNNNIIGDVMQGQFALYFVENGLINNLEFKSLIFFLRKRLKFIGKLFVRFYPQFQNTKKPIGVRMGKGKGSLNDYYIYVEKGQIFLEFGFYKKLLTLNMVDR